MATISQTDAQLLTIGESLALDFPTLHNITIEQHYNDSWSLNVELDNYRELDINLTHDNVFVMGIYLWPNDFDFLEFEDMQEAYLAAFSYLVGEDDEEEDTVIEDEEE